MSLSRNACSYRPKPEPAQPSPDVHPVPRSGVLAPMAAVYPEPRPEPTGHRPAAPRRRISCPTLSSSLAGKGVQVAFDGGRLTSDAGVLVLADIERRLGIAERLAHCLTDPRSPDRDITPWPR